jgi:hypothetical protein
MIDQQEQTLMVNGVRLQTFRRSYAQILCGDDPWLPLGNMMHQFFGAYQAYRAELVADSIEVPADVSAEDFRWAVFCAASVEYLCQKYDLSCPSWALDERYILAEPWYYDLAGDLPEVQEELREITPEAFARRNVFCGDDVYRNKYEYRGRKTA